MALDESDRHAILRVLEECPEDLLELRATLVQEAAWRQRDALQWAPGFYVFSAVDSAHQPATSGGTTMRERLPLILSTTALVVAVLGATPLGEAAYNAIAPNSIGARELRDGAVTNAKLRGDAVTSGKVLNGSLKKIDFKAGQIPEGPRGPKGDKGDKGDKGSKGDKGDPSALSCPSGTTRFVSVCIEKTARAPKGWSPASDDCAKDQRRLPSSGELAAFRKQPGVTISGAEWSADLGDVTYKSSFVYFAFTQNGNGVTEAPTATAYRCVAGLQNGN